MPETIPENVEIVLKARKILEKSPKIPVKFLEID
jgi:hypothetical protein